MRACSDAAQRRRLSQIRSNPTEGASSDATIHTSCFQPKWVRRIRESLRSESLRPERLHLVSLCPEGQRPETLHPESLHVEVLHHESL